jgi:lipid-A-disaccharide synthase
LIQEQCTPQNIADRALKILDDPREVEKIRYQLERVKEKMGGPGASERAADAILTLLEKQAPHPEGPDHAAKS